MNIHKLKLSKFKNLHLNSIDTITYTPEADIQLIIGSNGSGKSSLLNQLTPLFPDPKQMLPGGYKTIWFEHNHNEYWLHSTYNGKSAKHSFKVQDATGDWVELNNGGTGSVQKNLIEQHMGMTTDMLKIWLGRTRFTSMTPSKRRALILSLSGSDLEFAMRVYNNSKQLTNDAKGVEKHYISRLAEETTEIGDKTEIKRLESAVTKLTKELHEILILKDNNVPSAGTVKVEIDKLIKEFHETAAPILTYTGFKPNFLEGKVTLKEVWDYLTELRTTIKSNEATLSGYHSDMVELTTAIEDMRKTGVDDVGELATVIQKETISLEKDISKCALYSHLEGLNIPQIDTIYKTVKGDLVEAISLLTDNSDQKYTQATVSEARLRKENIDKKLNWLGVHRSKLIAEIDHFNNTCDVTCPSCNNAFKPGFNFDLNEHQLSLSKAVEEDERLNKELSEIVEFLDEAMVFSAQVKRIKAIFTNNDCLMFIYDKLIEENLYKVVPLKHMATLNKFSSDLEMASDIYERKVKIDESQYVLHKMQGMGRSNDLTDKYIAQLNDKINAVLTENDGLRFKFDRGLAWYKQMSHLAECSKKAKEIKQTIDQRLDTLCLAIRNSALSNHGQQKQYDLANATNALNAINRRDAVVKELSTEKDKATAKFLDLKNITDALSPVNGLISKYIQNFIDVFVSEMNNIISDIWTYPMEILGCGVDSDDVNCKFPLSIKDGYLVNEDVSEGSDGQKDIVDFAFKLIVGRYYGLKDVPLYLDELAPTLDEQHRINLIRYLGVLMETGHYNQMFMISHYSSNHNAFLNSEFLVLDESNLITKPSTYNKNAVIEQHAGLSEETP